MRIAALLFSALVVVSHLFAQPKLFTRETDVCTPPREHSLDFQELKLDLAFDLKKSIVKGKATHLFTPLRNSVDNFFLDAAGDFTIKEANINGSKIEFLREGEGFIFYPKTALTFGNKYTLQITYEAKPKKGLYFVGWDDSTNISKKQIWTQGQATDNRHWIPMYDEMNDKLITEVNITFAKDYKVLSNGAKLLEKDNPDGTKTWRYRMEKPHAPYLVMLAIGKYDIKEYKSKSGIPLRMYYYPEHKDRVDVIYKYMVQMFDFMEKETGVPYPWKPTYSQVPVQDFMYGAMENTSAVIFGDFYCVDARAYLDRNYVATNAHELAHMWFGDLITARSESDTWLQESFATHYQWLFDREAFGKDAFDWNRRLANNEALQASQADKKAVASTNGGRIRWYPKGAFVIEMMKYIVGREEYNRVIKYYLEKNAYKNVDANELLIAFQDVLGVSLNWFWEQWIYKGGEPHYKVAYSQIRNQKNERYTEITVEQTHETNPLVGLFKMPIKIEVWYKDGSKDSTVAMIENAYHKISIPNKNNLEVDFVLFDPNSQVLKSVTFTKYQEELMKQALKAPHMLDRYDAVAALKNVDIEKKREALISVFIREKFHAVKGEIISQLAADTAKASKQILLQSIKDKDPAVRRAVLNHLTTITMEWEPHIATLLKDSSYVNVELALDKLAQQYPHKLSDYLEITKNEIGNSGRNIRIKWLEWACSTDKSKYLPELVAYACPPYEFRTRLNAMESLKRMNYLDEKLLSGLLNSAKHFNARLASPAEQLLLHYAKQTEYKKTMVSYLNSDKCTVEEQMLLKKVIK